MAGKGQFAFDPDAVRGFAEVFAEAKTQVEQIKGELTATSAKAGDFGQTWAKEGGEFEQHFQALAADIGNLAAHLGNIHANLMQGTDLTVSTDLGGYTQFKDVQSELDRHKPVPPGAGGR